MSLVNDLLNQLQNSGAVEQMAGQLGAGQEQTGNAIAAALPMIMGALGNQAQSNDGAANVLQAVQGLSSGGQAGGLDLGGLLGGLLGGNAPAQTGGLDLGGLLGSVLGGQQGGGAGAIFGQILGGQQQAQMQETVGQATGLSNGQMGSLIGMLAPLVMGALAQRMQGNSMDAGALSNVLGQEQAEIRQEGGLGSSLMNAMLDRNGDGKTDLSDLLSLGASFLSRR